MTVVETPSLLREATVFAVECAGGRVAIRQKEESSSLDREHYTRSILSSRLLEFTLEFTQGGRRKRLKSNINCLIKPNGALRWSRS